jgi:hypothetical protein
VKGFRTRLAGAHFQVYRVSNCCVRVLAERRVRALSMGHSNCSETRPPTSCRFVCGCGGSKGSHVVRYILSTLCREFCHHLDFKKLGSVRIEGRDLGVRGPMGMPVQLHIFQLFLVHPEIVTEFVDDGQADLFAGFCLAAAGCLNFFCRGRYDRVRSQVEYAFLGGGHAMKDAEKQPPVLSRLR